MIVVDTGVLYAAADEDDHPACAQLLVRDGNKRSLTSTSGNKRARLELAR